MRFFYILFSVVLGVAGQLLFKAAVNGKGCPTVIDAAKCSILSPHFWLGLIAYGASLILWMKVLADNDLSFARPFAGVGYIFTAFSASILFSEQITPMRWIGIIFIVAGVFFVARS